MGKQLRGIKGKDAVNAFIKAGGIPKGGKGDHSNIKMSNGLIITIPQSGEVKIGLLKSAIRKAGLTEKEFLKLI